jgi:hypothetical protein
MAVDILDGNLSAASLLRFLCIEANLLQCIDEDAGNRLCIKSATWDVEEGLRIVGMDDRVYSIQLKPIVKAIHSDSWIKLY